MMKTLVELFLSFGKIGLISLGGGNSMLKLLEYEAVNYRHWIGKEEFVSMLGSSFLFPGLTGVKLAALIGYKVAGVAGLLVAILCLNIPGLLMTIVGYQWLVMHDTALTRKIMVGVQYGAIALLAAATFSVAQGVAGIYISVPIAIACGIFTLGLTLFNVSPFWGFMVFIAVCCFLVG